MRGKTGGGDRGERVVSGYVHPRRVSFNPGGGGKGGKNFFHGMKKRRGEGREAASKRGVALVERYKCVNRSCYAWIQVVRPAATF